MNDSLTYVLNLLPSLIIAFLAFYFFRIFFENEEKRRRITLIESLKKDTTSTRLQAYERLILLLERMHLPRLISRISSEKKTKEAYANILIANIEKEFDYNLSQQLYVTKDCWKIIETTKITTVGIIQKAVLQEGVYSPETLKEVLLRKLNSDDLPTIKALNFLKGEAQKMWR